MRRYDSPDGQMEDIEDGEYVRVDELISWVDSILRTSETKDNVIDALINEIEELERK